MTRTAILAIDQGTTSSRAIVFDASGAALCSAQKELPQLYPADGWVEHDPEVIWSTTLEVARQAFAESEAHGSHVVAIGLTNQRETTLMWDRQTGAPIHNAIVWQDRRTAQACMRLRGQGMEGEISARTGLLIDPYFSATKLAWLLDHVPDARRRAEAGELAFGTVDSFLVWRLTGGALHVTDATNASRTLLYDIHRNCWSEELLRLFGVPAAVLPEVRDCAAHFGMTRKELFGRSLPILGIAGDQQAAAIGQRCFEPGSVKSTYGTGCFIIVNTGPRAVASRNRLLTTIAHRLDGRITYALEGAIFVAGAAVQWLRDDLRVISSAAETETLARSLVDNGGVYMVPAFTGLGAPHWDPKARGALLGLTRATGRAELARAALESACYQTRDLLGAIEQDGVSVSKLRVDGGMAANSWFLQFLADILDRPVARPAMVETTALGAAYLAGREAGIYGSFEELAAAPEDISRFEPRMPDATRQALLFGWKDALRKVLGARPDSP